MNPIRGFNLNNILTEGIMNSMLIRCWRGVWALSVVALSIAIVACQPKSEEPSKANDNLGVKPLEKIEGEEVAVLTDPPNVPPPIKRTHATKVIVTMEVVEKEMRLADGVTYMFWTFGGSVPGKFIRVREGDLVEFHLKNHPKNTLPHNIDLHAVTGQGGGAAASETAPGHESVFSFTALNPGLYLYHCATAPVGMHIANGMYGLILVEPKDGMSPVDKEYYVCQGDFYTKGANGEAGLQPFDQPKAVAEQPDYVVFNGSVGSLTGDKSLKAKAGEKIRLYVGNGGPNLVSSFHVIGEIFDNVYQEGGSVPNHNVQTTLVPAGGSAIVEFRAEVPATYILVDHSIFRTFNKGSLGMLKVEGAENKTIYSGKQKDGTYTPDSSSASTTSPMTVQPEVLSAHTKAERIKAGKLVFTQVCQACHQPDGKGLPDKFPPLVASDFLNADKKRAIQILLHGLNGEITVNGKKFNSSMPEFPLSDQQIACALTYVLNSFGNKGGDITPEQVAAIRKDGGIASK